MLIIAGSKSQGDVICRSQVTRGKASPRGKRPALDQRLKKGVVSKQVAEKEQGRQPEGGGMQIHVGRTRGLEIMGADDWRKREGLDRIYVTKGTAYPADSKSSRRRQALLHSRLDSWVIGDCRIEGLRRMGSLAHHTAGWHRRRG
jgi:hypothetical protein